MVDDRKKLIPHDPRRNEAEFDLATERLTFSREPWIGATFVLRIVDSGEVERLLPRVEGELDPEQDEQVLTVRKLRNVAREMQGLPLLPSGFDEATRVEAEVRSVDERP